MANRLMAHRSFYNFVESEAEKKPYPNPSRHVCEYDSHVEMSNEKSLMVDDDGSTEKHINAQHIS